MMKISDYLQQRARRHEYWYLASFIPAALVSMFKPDGFLSLSSMQREH